MRAVRPLVLTLAAATMAAAPLAPLDARAATMPTVSITSPTNGSTVVGKVAVAVAGDVDPGDHDGAMTTLLINGTTVGAPQHCGTAIPGGANCPTSFTWDTTGLNGSYALAAYLQVPSALGQVVANAQVTAANPLPQVSITSPEANAVVKGGSLSVAATGSVELSQSDQPALLQLWVDGAKYGIPHDCTEAPTTAKLCHGTFTVSQPTWTGTHNVQVTMATQLTSASSATVPYDFYTDTRTSLRPISTVRAGKHVGVRGQVVALNNGAGVAGARVVVTITPAVGKKRALVLHTGSTGHFSLATAITANSTVTASVSGARDFGRSHASTKAKALAPIVCKADLNVHPRRIGVGTCTVAHLPDGTKVVLEYQSKKKWHVLGSGPTKGTDILISYKFGAPGHYPVRIVLGANKVYAATNGTPFTVNVG